MSALVGEWSGIYVSRASGRSGSIVFTLTAGADTARGDVVMIPAGSDEAMEYAPQAREANPVPQVLTIEFVRAESNTVSGRLAPYRDPVCGCVLATTFQGALEGGKIEGTFNTYHSVSGERQTGTWEVWRKEG